MQTEPIFLNFPCHDPPAILTSPLFFSNALCWLLYYLHFVQALLSAWTYHPFLLYLLNVLYSSRLNVSPTSPMKPLLTILICTNPSFPWGMRPAQAISHCYLHVSHLQIRKDNKVLQFVFLIISIPELLEELQEMT